MSRANYLRSIETNILNLEGLNVDSFIRECHQNYFSMKHQENEDVSMENQNKAEIVENTHIFPYCGESIKVLVGDKFRKVGSENNIQDVQNYPLGNIKKAKELEDLYMDCDSGNNIFEEGRNQGTTDRNKSSEAKNQPRQNALAIMCSGMEIDEYPEKVSTEEGNHESYCGLKTYEVGQDSAKRLLERTAFLNDIPVRNSNENKNPLPIENSHKDSSLSSFNDLNQSILNTYFKAVSRDLEPRSSCSPLISNSPNCYNSAAALAPIESKANFNPNEMKAIFSNAAKLLSCSLNKSKQIKEPKESEPEEDYFQRHSSDQQNLLEEKIGISATKGIINPETLSHYGRILNITKNMNSDIPNADAIIKAYRSKLKSKNWNTYLKNSFETNIKNKFKFYHKCNFPGCNRTFSSSGWLKTHLEEHMEEIKNDEFNIEFNGCISNIKV